MAIEEKDPCADQKRDQIENNCRDYNCMVHKDGQVSGGWCASTLLNFFLGGGHQHPDRKKQVADILLKCPPLPSNGRATKKIWYDENGDITESPAKACTIIEVGTKADDDSCPTSHIGVDIVDMYKMASQAAALAFIAGEVPAFPADPESPAECYELQVVGTNLVPWVHPPEFHPLWDTFNPIQQCLADPCFAREVCEDSPLAQYIDFDENGNGIALEMPPIVVPVKEWVDVSKLDIKVPSHRTMYGPDHTDEEPQVCYEVAVVCYNGETGEKSLDVCYIDADGTVTDEFPVGYKFPEECAVVAVPPVGEEVKVPTFKDGEPITEIQVPCIFFGVTYNSLDGIINAVRETLECPEVTLQEEGAMWCIPATCPIIPPQVNLRTPNVGCTCVYTDWIDSANSTMTDLGGGIYEGVTVDGDRWRVVAPSDWIHTDGGLPNDFNILVTPDNSTGSVTLTIEEVGDTPAGNVDCPSEVRAVFIMYDADVLGSSFAASSNAGEPFGVGVEGTTFAGVNPWTISPPNNVGNDNPNDQFLVITNDANPSPGDFMTVDVDLSVGQPFVGERLGWRVIFQRRTGSCA